MGLTRMIWITIPLPPLEEQRIIVKECERRMSIIDEISSEVETNLKRAERLRQSILKKASAEPLHSHEERIVKGRRGRAGLKGQLIEKSIDAFVLALETIK